MGKFLEQASLRRPGQLEKLPPLANGLLHKHLDMGNLRVCTGRN